MGGNTRQWAVTMRDRQRLLAASRLGVDPARSLVVEDSLNGVLAGRAAGATVMLVPNKTTPPHAGTGDHAHLVRASLAELVPLVAGEPAYP